MSKFTSTFIGSTLAIVLALTIAMSGCGQAKVTGDQLEQTRITAKDNATWNGKQYRALDPRLAEFQLIPNGDSSIRPECPMGDGWATIELVGVEPPRSIKLKCSTNSRATGCLLEGAFTAKTEYSDGSCNNKMPFPIEKLTQ